MMMPHQLGKGVWETAKLPRKTQGIMRKIVQSKCARLVPDLKARHANQATKPNGMMAKANKMIVKTSAEARCSGRVSFSAKPAKNQIAAVMDNAAPNPAMIIESLSALRPIGAGVSSRCPTGVMTVSSLILIA